jgi:hypothetical protein
MIQRLQKLRASMAIGGAMICGQCRRQYRPHAQHALRGPRPLDDFAKANKRDLRRVNDFINGSIAKSGARGLVG